MAERPKQQIEKSRQLRKVSTWPEKILWSKLRGGQLNGIKFRRQHPVLGHIVDFACAKAKVALELDGGSHDASRLDADARKNKVLTEHGWLVLRFQNADATNHLDALLENVLMACVDRLGKVD